MNVIETSLDGVLIIEPKVFMDNRGYFVETWRKERYESVGIKHSRLFTTEKRGFK